MHAHPHVSECRKPSSTKIASLFCAALFTLLAFAGFTAQAQVNTGSLSGQITDSSGAAVSGAQVSIVDPSTGYTRTEKSQPDGQYQMPNLPIGVYTLSVSAPGFDVEKESVTINVGARARADLHMRVGSESQTVQVTAQDNALARDDASISSIVTQDTITETPLFLRNWDDLLRVVPGVQINRYTNQAGSTAAGRTGDFNVNGVHSLQNNFILDGIDNNTFSENVQELSTEAAHPSVDVIAEFNVITNPYSAEYGRAPGAVVSVNTRSGTNQIHGTAYEYVRNQFFDAFDYFSKQSLKAKAEDNQNQFGGSLGGPILRNRLFFFGNYEETRIKQGVSRVATVPLDNERVGNFSPAAAAADGISPYPTIYDPTTCSTPYNLKSGGCQPYPNNQIPSSQIDSSVSALMALFPEPNFKNGAANYPELNNYSRTGALTDFNGSLDTRVDWTASPVDTVFARFNYFNRTRDIPGYFGGLADGSATSAWGNQILKGASLVLGWTRVLSPTMVNDFRFGWVRDYSFAEQQPFTLSQNASQFVPGIPDNPAIGGGVPLTAFTNKTFLGSPDYLPKQQVPMLYQYVDTLSWTHGNQTLKVGANLYAPMRNLFQDEPGTRGDLTFTGIFTGLSYADGLIGATEYTQLTNVFFVDQRMWMASGYVEDDWKATPRLTLNLGLRYDFNTPAYEGQNRMANFNPAGVGSLVFAKSGSLYDRTLVHPNTTDFAPRIGVSFALDNNTVLHAGFGMYYTGLERIGSENQLAENPPNLINKTLASNSHPVLKPSVGFPSNFLNPSTINFNQLQNFHIRSENPNLAPPTVKQWSVGIQRQVGPDWLAELDYVGTHSSNLDVLRNYNQVLISGNQVVTSASAPGGTVPYADFGQVEYMDSIGRGNYDGLQASLVRAMKNGLSVRAAYTYSHALDNAPEELESNSGDAPNGRNNYAWYGNADFDVRNRISATYVYLFPFGRGRAMLQHGPASWILGDWQTSGVYTYYSGHPFTANWGSESSLLDAYGFATAVPNVAAPVHYLKSQECWFYDNLNPNCKSTGNASTPYTDPGKYNIGNSGRNTLVGPPTDLFDFALIREIPITNRWSSEFRWEVFNLANHAVFGQPSGNVSNSSAAAITTLSADPRVMQFALRVSW